MTLQEIRSKLNENVGNNVTIRCNLGRNKFEKYNVKIKETYRNVFVVELVDQHSQVKSFSYTDVMTKTIKIDY